VVAVLRPSAGPPEMLALGPPMVVVTASPWTTLLLHHTGDHHCSYCPVTPAHRHATTTTLTTRTGLNTRQRPCTVLGNTHPQPLQHHPTAGGIQSDTSRNLVNPSIGITSESLINLGSSHNLTRSADKVRSSYSLIDHLVEVIPVSVNSVAVASENSYSNSENNSGVGAAEVCV